MIAHLKDRAAALAALGWTGDDAEWLAFVCLHSGAFLRSQYLGFIEKSDRSAATRFIQRCGSIAVEERWNGTTAKVCRIVARPVYRALGAEHIRHRREAAAALLVRRLLAFDYVVDHPHRPWLPTEDEKVTTLTAVGVPEAALPRRVYPATGTGLGQTRYFVNKLPVALDATHATFVYVQVGEDAECALRSWGESHAGLWAALRETGRAVAVVVVGLGRGVLPVTEKVLREWQSAPIGSAAAALTAERDAIRAAIEQTDEAVLTRYGGLPGAGRRLIELQGQGHGTAAPSDRNGGPWIASGAVWRSKRVLS